MERRKKEAEIRARLKRNLDESSEECKRKYDEINRKWPILLLSDDPVNVHYQMQILNEQCLDVLAKKDAVIEEIRKELVRADDKYFEDQQMQEIDIKLLMDRIDTQV